VARPLRFKANESRQTGGGYGEVSKVAERR
jgi:hypothetical protein